jgi:predicted nucleotidyltransferase
MNDVFQSFDTQSTLNPLIWTNADSDDFQLIKLFPDIRKHLLKVVDLFMENIKFSHLEVEDIVFTGSLANYNWSNYSDIDLHIVVNKKSISVNPEVLDDYFTIKKEMFNTRHNIKIKQFDVEIYVQDVEEQTMAMGIYSVLYNQWIKTPNKGNTAIDKDNIRKKVQGFIDQINLIDYKIKHDESPAEIVTMIQTLKDKIKKYRKSGLASGGEYSDENLVFKYLRRTKYLEKLSDYKVQTIDKMLSLQEID